MDEKCKEDGKKRINKGKRNAWKFMDRSDQRKVMNVGIGKPKAMKGHKQGRKNYISDK